MKVKISPFFFLGFPCKHLLYLQRDFSEDGIWLRTLQEIQQWWMMEAAQTGKSVALARPCNGNINLCNILKLPSAVNEKKTLKTTFDQISNNRFKIPNYKWKCPTTNPPCIYIFEVKQPRERERQPTYHTPCYSEIERERGEEELAVMASRLMWASRAAFHLRISVFNRGFATVLKDLKYSDSHEWAKVEGGSVTVGITDHAQDHLGDVVYVELPEVGSSVTQGSSFGAVESVKATSDLNSPVSGKIVEVNEELSSSPGLVNSSPFENGWIIKVELSDSGEVGKLMDSERYSKFCEEEDAAH
ncbi:hypothetical protein SAY87_022823 [Trapa incisa]|uniref:Lipoyl-binding domain-containing protein n=2 Tax=Trapa TaxID=22665 RepID=A0AAN7Q527_9MYRT|nr:hypothetical protein SAY87_022823 [Trapa incisa]